MPSCKHLLGVKFVYFNFVLISCWHAYDHQKKSKSLWNSSNCDITRSQTNSLDFDEILSRIKLWPQYHYQKVQRPMLSLPGFSYAMEKLWDNQNQVNCTSARYLISYGWPHGFGSTIHVEGVALAIALQLKRIFLYHPDGPPRFWPRESTIREGSSGWETNCSFCRERNVSTLDCYYEKLSSCSYNDAFQGNSLSTLNPRVFNQFDIFEGRRFSKLNSKFIESIKNEQVIIFQAVSVSTHFIPDIFKPIVDCSRINSKFQYYWWRAISTAYLLRPNNNTLKELAKHRKILPQLNKNEYCVGMYVRRGDKAIEMALPNFTFFANTAKFLWNHGYVHKNLSVTGSNSTTISDIRTIIVSSEDDSVIKEAKAWGEANNWRIISTDIVDRAQLTAGKSRDSQVASWNSNSEYHDDNEYLSMLLNIDMLLQCDAWVCTLASNFCRVIDELRVTVAGKINNHYADLSKETCKIPPCIGSKNIISFEW